MDLGASHVLSTPTSLSASLIISFLLILSPAVVADLISYEAMIRSDLRFKVQLWHSQCTGERLGETILDVHEVWLCVRVAG